jgi:N-acyl-phosphatidylethanolamine-hydrolysing phospholipase D
VREFFVANAGHWIDEFHLDGRGFLDGHGFDATQAAPGRGRKRRAGETPRAGRRPRSRPRGQERGVYFPSSGRGAVSAGSAIPSSSVKEDLVPFRPGRPAARFSVWLALLVVALATTGVSPWGAVPPDGTTRAAPRHHLAIGFRNLNPEFARPAPWKHVRALVARIGPALRGDYRVTALGAARADASALHGDSGRPTVTWVGHSTLLIRLDGLNFLTDPHWSAKAGPFSGRIGATRYTPPGLAFEDLPVIDFVVISHDHYDHLDEPTVRRLARTHNPRFLVPLGIKAWLADRGIENAVELDWGESTTVNGLTVVCTPAQHYSGRSLADQGRRLWASWVVLGTKRFYFAGDSGYYRHFREIGEAYGPFDLAAMPIGSYTPRHTTRALHTSPEEALQAWLDLRARRFVGVHWGTFALLHEPYDEPPRRLAAEVQRRGLDAEAIWVLKPGETRPW